MYLKKNKNVNKKIKYPIFSSSPKKASVRNELLIKIKEVKNKKFILKVDVWLFIINIRYKGRIQTKEIKNVYNLNINILSAGIIYFVIK